MDMPCPIVQISTVSRARVPLPLEMRRINIWPNGHWMHQSYGHVMMDAWSKLPDCTGMLWLEGDIAICPEHLEELQDEIKAHPSLVIAVPYLLYPKSTMRSTPMWSVRGQEADGSPINYEGHNPVPLTPEYFSLGCTYLPRKLLSLVNMSNGNWDYPVLDTRLSELALAHKIMCITTSVPAMHLNY